VFNHPEILEDPEMNPDLDTLATGVYVTVDDLIVGHPHWTPERPEIGLAPKLSDAELITLAIIQALLGYTSEAAFIRYAHAHLRPWFPYLPDRPGYNKRLRHAVGLMGHITSALARACASWHDDVWLVDSTPIECGRSRATAKRSDLVGWATYGYCASHSRYFWGLRLHLITTPSGLPIRFGLTGAKTDERDTCLDLLTTLDENRAGQILIADKGYRRASFETELTDTGITLIRPALRSEAPRPAQRFLKPFRQIIESVNQTLKSQLNLERHGGRTKPGVCARILQRILALTAAIWHNETTERTGPARSLTPYDH
jgi:hypothetical protein